MNWGWRQYMLSWMVLGTVLTNQCSSVESCIEEERLALLEINSYMKSHVDSEYHQFFTSLDEGEKDRYNCCSWVRIQCNPTTRRVTMLNLGSMMVSMKKPGVFNVTAFKPLRELISLDLSSNGITSLVEKDGSRRASSLEHLQSFMLDSNNFENGSFFLGDLISLKKLSLSNCFLDQSTFPFQELANLRELQVLDLSYNYFLGGSIREIINLRELQVLDLTYSSFHGHLQGFCDLKNLTQLYLSNNHFSGVLPSCIHNLSSLQVLDLSLNQINNPTEESLSNIFRNLSYLEYLDLSDNHFEGKLSLSSFANLSKLQFLDLSKNKLKVDTGDILWQSSFQLQYLGLQGCGLNNWNGAAARFFSQQHNLSYINLADNDFVGPFPSWLSYNGSMLRDLDLEMDSAALPSYSRHPLDTLIISGNNFSGKLPENIGFLFPQLINLNMSGCHFEGSIPASLAHMRRLEVLDLSFNNLSGELPTRLFSDSTSLVVLLLSDNNLQGEIIPEHMNLPTLQALKLSNNRFHGTIKDGLQKSPILSVLDISNNKVNGSFPSWIGNFSFLMTLSVSENIMQGQIPAEICKLQGLAHLHLSQNNFTGSIPSCSNFSNLETMLLHDNNFTGSLPSALSSSSALVVLDLSNNQLSGSIPQWISKFLGLQALLLAGNHFHGQIPNELCKLQAINVLDLSNNDLSGGILKCFASMFIGIYPLMTLTTRSIPVIIGDNGGLLLYVFVTIEMDLLVKNQFMTYEDNGLALMSGLDLSCNKFSGVIPSELGELRHVRSLNLSHNRLVGPIPGSFSNLSEVESLDLSYNNLSGMIPGRLVELNFLEIFNVSYNNLTGRTPNTGQFATFDDTIYLGNPGLCGPSLNKSCDIVPADSLPSPASTTAKEDGDVGALDMEDFLWSFAMASFIAFMSTILVLAINPQWREALFGFLEWHLLWWLI